MSGRIITISREFGSGGRTIGRKLAERLGIPCYDQELIGKIAEESGFTREFVEARGGNIPRRPAASAVFWPGGISMAMRPRMRSGTSNGKSLRN